jgi:hypothetical protein
VRALALGRDAQRALVELDGDLFLGDAGQVERIDELLVRFRRLDSRDPALRRPPVALEEPFMSG